MKVLKSVVRYKNYAKRGMLVGIAISLLTVTVIATSQNKALAVKIPTPATAVLYGDSIMYESYWQIQSSFSAKKGWTNKVNAFPGYAPCDWFTKLQEDLVALKPKIVVIETQGNSYTDCMRDANGVLIPYGSQAWLDKYRADLAFYFSTASAAGAKVLVVYPLPVPTIYPAGNTHVKNLMNVMKSEAAKYHGISVTAAPRNSVSNTGKYVEEKKCLATETQAVGCGATTIGKIRVREPNGGIHLCSAAYTTPQSFLAGCQVYSSGIVRWGKALVNTTVSPPAPILP